MNEHYPEMLIDLEDNTC